MKLRVDDITAEAKDILFPEPEQEINRTLTEGPVREYRVEGPIAVAVSYYRAGAEVFLTGELTAHTVARCARCLEEFSAPSKRPFRYVLTPRVMGDGAGDDEREDLEYSVYDGEEIDLTPFIREQMLLALPTRPLCSDDCRGLCPRCGANRNERDCGCREDMFDPRLSVLRSLKLYRS
jgi:uncharacterized protein